MAKSKLWIAFAACVAVATAQQQTKLGGVTSPYINATYQVGIIPYDVYIQDAVTKACAQTGIKQTVYIVASAAPLDTPTTVATGCNTTSIIDGRFAPANVYTWNGTHYVLYVPTPPSGGVTAVTGGSAHGLTVYSSGGTTPSITAGADSYHYIPVTTGGGILFLADDGTYKTPTAGGMAGGDLNGTYPNPTLAGTYGGSPLCTQASKCPASGTTAVTCAILSSPAFNCYRINADGAIEEWGLSQVCGSTTCSINFPYPFPSTTYLSVSANMQSTAGNITATVANITTSGFTVYNNGVVNVGGSGGAYNGGNPNYWHATGK